MSDLSALSKGSGGASAPAPAPSPAPKKSDYKGFVAGVFSGIAKLSGKFLLAYMHYS